MAESIVFNNATFIIPDVGESNWGQNLTNYFVAIPQGTYQLSGGTKPLTADLSFGTNFGIFAKYFTSTTATPATTGSIRLANADSASWRNAGNSADVSIGVNGGNQFNYSGNGIIASSFGSLTPATTASTAGIVRLAKGESIGWRNNADGGNLLLAIDSSDRLLYNGSIVSTAASSVTSITGTANQVIASASTGAVTLSTPQNIGTGSAPTFDHLTLAKTTSQIILGTTNTTTLSATAPSVSRVYTIPDAGGSANVMLDAGNYTVTGTWTGVTLVTPALGTPASGALTNCTSIPVANATGTLGVAHGGTNAVTLTSGGVLYGNGASTIQATAAPTQYQVCVGNVSGLPSFAAVTLSQAAAVTGTLPVGNGGTGQTALSAFVPTIQKFLSGSGTYTTPVGCTWIRVRMAGGGGGGGASGTSGGSNPNGTTGGNSSFGTTLLVANGGVGGFGGGNSANGAAGGTASLGSGPIGIAIGGGNGGMAGSDSSVASSGGGPGGVNALGGSAGTVYAGVAGQAGITNTGAGGGGGAAGATPSFSGGGGGAGGFIDAIITAPSATYSYVVGAGNAGGTAGTNGFAGGAGGSGVIVVEEHYI